MPVPILVSNYRDSTGSLINEGNIQLIYNTKYITLGDNIQQWQFVSRFYVCQSLTTYPLYITDLQIKLVIFITYCVINKSCSIKLATNGRIHPPYVRITYNTTSTRSKVTHTVIYCYVTICVYRVASQFNISVREMC